MKACKWYTAALAVAGLLGIVGGAQAATISIIGDSGSLRVVTPTLNSSVSIVKPYGTATVPNITQVTATQYEIDFVPTADFFASATAQPGGQTTTMDGKLDFYVTFPSPIPLTVNVFEDGIWQTTGTGTVNVNGGMIVTPVDPVTHTNLALPVGGTFGTPTFTGNSKGTWDLFGQATGFANQYTTYKISIDNVLVANAPLPAPGDAYIAKKDFSILLTTDGSGAPAPEPASLGVLALGGLALLARRRRG